MFQPDAIFYEKNIKEYKLGRELLERYQHQKIPMTIIENHNNIEQMRKKENKEFPQMKKNLIIATRKTHKYQENHKVSNYLVPYTSSGCVAMCMYCYLVCNYNKCAYLRLFVNREYMLDKLKRKANSADKDLVFEIGSNSDLILENTITGNLEWTIENFKDNEKGKITFPTKFDMVEPILDLDHRGKVIVRMSLNPAEIINKVEFGTSRLENRIEAINKLVEAGYPVGILIAPIILVDNWKVLYENLLKQMVTMLSEKAKKTVFFELIFMTYSYVHNAINHEAFPNAIELYSREQMTGRGRGKYAYKPAIKEEARQYMLELMHQYFPYNEIKYIV